MTRGGVLLAVALTLVMAPATAAGQGASQPDLMFVSRGGDVLTGDDLYGDDGVGQQRSITVEDRTVLVIRIENDGPGDDVFMISASRPNPGFRVRYLDGRHDVTTDVIAGDPTDSFGPAVKAGAFARLRVVIDVDPTAELGTDLSLVIRATNGSADTLRIKAVKTSTPD